MVEGRQRSFRGNGCQCGAPGESLFPAPAGTPQTVARAPLSTPGANPPQESSAPSVHSRSRSSGFCKRRCRTWVLGSGTFSSHLPTARSLSTNIDWAPVFFLRQRCLMLCDHPFPPTVIPTFLVLTTRRMHASSRPFFNARKHRGQAESPWAW